MKFLTPNIQLAYFPILTRFHGRNYHNRLCHYDTNIILIVSLPSQKHPRRKIGYGKDY